MRCQNMEMRSHQDVGEWWTRRSEKHRHGVASSASEGTVQIGDWEWNWEPDGRASRVCQARLW